MNWSRFKNHQIGQPFFVIGEETVTQGGQGHVVQSESYTKDKNPHPWSREQTTQRAGIPDQEHRRPQR